MPHNMVGPRAIKWLGGGSRSGEGLAQNKKIDSKFFSQYFFDQKSRYRILVAKAPLKKDGSIGWQEPMKEIANVTLPASV